MTGNEVNTVVIDPNAKMGYLRITDKEVARTEPHGSYMLDLDADGELVGVEFFRIEVYPIVLTEKLLKETCVITRTDEDTVMKAITHILGNLPLSIEVIR